MIISFPKKVFVKYKYLKHSINNINFNSNNSQTILIYILIYINIYNYIYNYKLIRNIINYIYTYKLL